MQGPTSLYLDPNRCSSSASAEGLSKNLFSDPTKVHISSPIYGAREHFPILL